jgi:hypothetical protein
METFLLTLDGPQNSNIQIEVRYRTIILTQSNEVNKPKAFIHPVLNQSEQIGRIFAIGIIVNFVQFLCKLLKT